jgi:hypothetical protein
MISEIPRFRVLVAMKWDFSVRLKQQMIRNPELTFVGALAQLSIVRGLLNEIKNGLGESLVSDRPS